MRTHSKRPVSVADTLAGARLGIADLVVMVTSAAAPMTVIAAGATLQWAVTGQLGIPIAYLAVAAILTVFAVGLVDMSSHITNAGAFYATSLTVSADTSALVVPSSRCWPITPWRSACSVVLARSPHPGWPTSSTCLCRGGSAG